jgi:pimeloyl-ACP methyl ester carboxylesterase
MRGAAWVLVALVGCGGGEDEPRREIRMDAARVSFWDAPYPSDDLLEAGTVDLSDVPNPSNVLLIDDAIALVDGTADGFGATSAIFFSATVALDPAALPTVHASVQDGSPVFLFGIDPAAPDYLTRYPIEVRYQVDGGPFGAEHMLSLLPLQGVPLRPAGRYAAVVLRRLGDAEGVPLDRPAAIDVLIAGEPAYPALAEAATALADAGVSLQDVAGLTAFTTQDGPADLVRFVDHARSLSVPAPMAAFTLDPLHPEYCVYRTTVEIPVYQQGTPPFSSGGGAWPTDPEVQTYEQARLLVTIPRSPAPAGGYPTAVMIRTGGGGDLPLVDRGPVTEPGGAFTSGEGPALHFARAGFAGVTIDGPHGGLRNITDGDEQLLIFNIANPGAIRDNIRQSALEIALVPDILAGVSIDLGDCPDAAITGDLLDLDRLALMGHSMGATIAPLVLAVEPRYRAVILSGAGGSWIENIVHKQSPFHIRPFAEALLRYTALGRALDAHDPGLSFFQYAIEAADPPLYGPMILDRPDRPHILMIQGIVDTYILPPIANATSLSLRLDLAGPAHDATHPDLTDFTPIADLLPLAGRTTIPLPASSNASDTTAVLVQHLEDDLQDGHEVAFQLEPARLQYQTFLHTWLTASPTVP